MLRQRHALKRLCETKGSAVMWMLVLAMVLLVLTASMLALAGNIHRRSVEAIDHDQAYLTARAGAEAVALAYCDTALNGRLIAQMRTGETYPVEDLAGLPTGACTVEVTLDNIISVTVSATATCGDATETVRIILSLEWLDDDKVAGTVVRYER